MGGGGGGGGVCVCGFADSVAIICSRKKNSYIHIL